MKKLFLAVSATGLLMALDASATLVADFETSGSYVGSRTKSADTDTGDIWNYSDTVPLLNDTGLGGQSGRIYGGVITSWSVPQPAYSPWVLKNPGAGFVAQVIPPDVTGTQSVTGAYLWNKADFLEGAAEIVLFNPGDSISYHFDWMTATGTQQVRLIVKQGGVTYISEWWTSGYENISHDPTTTNWAVLDTTNYTWGAFSPVTFDDIEGAGLYYTLSVTGAQCAARLLDFQIDATVVPAPGTNEMVVDFGSSSVDMQGRALDSSTLEGAIWDYSDTTPLLNDADPTGQNGRIYGGVATTWSIPQEYTPPMYKNIDEGFTVQVNPTDVTGTQSLKAVYLWDKADFLAGSSDTVQFNDGHYISYNFSWVTAQTVQFRLVVKQGGVVYISEWSTVQYGNNGPNVTKNITETNWAVLNTADYTWGAFAPVTFDDVEGAGIYSQVSCINEQAAARLIDFQVMARVISAEPGENFGSWAASQVPPVTGGANGDDNNNGVANLVEYALTDGGERGVLSGNTITFTKRGAPYGGDLTYIIETSETLEAGSWSPDVTHGPDDLASPISYDLAPAPGMPKKFARLKVVQAP
jgi:hypothetical protein